jgi:hypothetical protein
MKIFFRETINLMIDLFNRIIDKEAKRVDELNSQFLGEV